MSQYRLLYSRRGSGDVERGMAYECSEAWIAHHVRFMSRAYPRNIYWYEIINPELPLKFVVRKEYL